jgi:hypothetical protein
MKPDALQNVDYLSFEWKPEDICATRYNISQYNINQRKPHLKVYRRLSNALWRAWTKLERNLKCSTPRFIGW